MQLTYWGLENYKSTVPVAATASKALCSQMNAMMMEQWHNHGYVSAIFTPHPLLGSDLLSQYSPPSLPSTQLTN